MCICCTAILAATLRFRLLMRFITANLNGIRSAASKGFFDWVSTQGVDALGVQEIKAQATDLSEALAHKSYDGRSSESEATPCH